LTKLKDRVGQDPSIKALSVFDLDYTLIAGNSSFKFCQYLSRRAVLPSFTPFYSFFYYLRHRFLNLSLSALHHKIFTCFLKGKSLELLESFVEPFIQEEISSLLYMPAIDHLRRAQHLGHFTLILSNSPEFLVKGIAEFLGVSGWHATRYAVDKDNMLSHVAAIMQGEDKAWQVKAIADKLNLDKSQITAYSDSHLDIPFLLSAGKAVAVNPNRKLLQISRKHNWPVI